MVQKGSTMKCGLVWLVGVCCLVQGISAQIQDAPDLFDQRNGPLVQALLEKGNYDQVVQLATLAMERGQDTVLWHDLRAEGLSAIGLVGEALTAIEKGLKSHPEDLVLLMKQHDLARSLGKSELAKQALQQINAAAKKSPLSQRSGEELIALGQAALAAGADAQKVIAQFYEPAKKKPGAVAAACLALGELALTKEDYKRAAEEFRAGLKENAESATLRFGLARAFQNSDRKRCVELLEQVLEKNPQHVSALILQAELLIGAEQFSEAEQMLERAVQVNSRQPEAWAIKAALALLVRNDLAESNSAREQGLRLWPQNPVVDSTIGRVFSRAYRFAEGSEHQRAALAMDASYLQAKVRLCHDLFRLGQEPEAWKLAGEIREADSYNAQAHNIGLLEDEMSGFVTLEREGFIIKMPQREEAIYAERGFAILREAKAKLGSKYGLTFDKPVLVEFFPTQQDFAIRTFGNLGGQGILGACFGTVVTMNSPGSLSAKRSNWESTLWHEFCHVVTLSVTRNRMPRWLSEGISVYEEGLRDPACGMRMTPQFRHMILEEEALTPVGKLSSAFISPKSGEHVMFAYYESSQVVSQIVETYGLEKLLSVLRDLAAGARINEALAKNLAPLEKLEADFAAHMRDLAETYAPEADFSEPEELNLKDPVAVAAHVQRRPNHVPVLRRHVQHLLENEQWEAAAQSAQSLIELLPDDISTGGGYELAAASLRGAGKAQEEAQVLRAWAGRSGDASPAYLRLIELDKASQNWSELQQSAQWLLAVNPFLKQPHEALATAAESLGQEADAIASWQKLQHLGPDNPAEVSFRLARLMQRKDVATARRYVLDALAEAPRHREALELLESLQTPVVR